jgi:hypothetical protein
MININAKSYAYWVINYDAFYTIFPLNCAAAQLTEMLPRTLNCYRAAGMFQISL